MNQSVDQINRLNVALMLIVCGAAVYAPFHTFLFAYAFLGPLHYLTEISWLHDRGYFVARQRERRLWLGFVILTAAVMAYGYASTELFGRLVRPTLEIGLFYAVFALAAIVLLVRHPVNAFALICVVAITLAGFSARPVYGIAAYLLMTIVHVFLFTGVFLVIGALKGKTHLGYLSVLVFLLSAATTLLVRAPSVAPDAAVRGLYDSFLQLNEILLRFAGSDHTSAYASGVGISVMRFIAFAYAYHYLNWFSKTSIIGWHAIGPRRAWAIALTWIAGVIVYAVDYRAGFALFYVMSVTHVMLEFPLNHHSFATLARPSLLKPRAGALAAVRS